ncbi:MAG: thioredoxin-disulfide reductase [Candidatus Omnitrophota bacterium]
MYDVIIIGAGPAGLTAALYCGRSKLRTKVIERSLAGGQINLTDEIENFPGSVKINSRNLVENMLKQVKELKDVELDEYKEVVSIKYNSDFKEVNCKSLVNEEKFNYKCKALIIASGAEPKKLGLKGEEKFMGKGISYCAVCDGPLFKDKEVVLVGGGDTALEEALYLTKFVRKVKIIHRRDAFRASGLLQERAENNAKIEFILNSVGVEILGKNFVEKIRIQDVKTKEEQEIGCSGVFIFVGYSPNTQFVKEVLDLGKDSYIDTNEEMLTKKNGIFACGDCRKRPFRQIVTACGEGAVAAHLAEQYLAKL